MKNKIWHVIGLMSGTSLDGVDLVYVEFIKNEEYTFEILKKESIIYSEKWKNKLQDAFDYSGENLIKLDADYGVFLAELIQNFITKNKIEKVDFIASHGHTIFHQPDKNYTYQIGNGAVINALTKIKVICDFRVQDVALGGQGAPLVPIILIFV
jgi:anhydro-N-acetylmuramic acid kinase